MRLEQLRADFARCHINPALQSLPFTEWTQVPRNLKGLYSIWEQDRCIYVGKTGSNITTRLLHHHNKAHAIWEQGTTDTKGWRLGRTRTTWAPQVWTIEYLTCESAVHRTYLEGAMMLLFDPECNDETVEDRLRGLVR